MKWGIKLKQNAFLEETKCYKYARMIISWYFVGENLWIIYTRICIQQKLAGESEKESVLFSK